MGEDKSVIMDVGTCPEYTNLEKQKHGVFVCSQKKKGFGGWWIVRYLHLVI